METRDHTIIGRAFDYYNNRRERTGAKLVVHRAYKLTEGALLGEGGIYQDIQRRKNNNEKNNTIIFAIFHLLKDALDPAYAEKLKTQKEVYKAIENRLGELKGLIQTELTSLLTQGSDHEQFSIHDEAKPLLVTLEEKSLPVNIDQSKQLRKTRKPSILIASEKREQSLKKKTRNSKVKSKSNEGGTHENNTSISANGESAHNNPSLNSIPRIKDKFWTPKKSFQNKREYAQAFSEIKYEPNPERKKICSTQLYTKLCTDAEKHKVSTDSKIKGYMTRAQRYIESNQIDDALIFELKFLAARIELLVKESTTKSNESSSG